MLGINEPIKNTLVALLVTLEMTQPTFIHFILLLVKFPNKIYYYFHYKKYF
jgi:hypothetical protein